ncbi:MAG: hypothetical protein AB1801_27685, partial [Chloroflexota bacterium]
GPESRLAVVPIVRAFDWAGRLVGSSQLESPFPAYYIPPGDIFKDSFELQFEAPPATWVWLNVSLAEDFTLPLNAAGDPDNGFIASVNVEVFPPALPNFGGVIGKPILLAGDDYRPGQAIPLQFIWQASEAAAGAAALALNLFDAAGQLVVQQPQPLQSLGLAPDRPLTATYCFSLPAALAAGEYVLALELEAAAGGVLLDETNQAAPAISMPIHLATADTGENVATTSIPATGICQLLQADFPRRYEPTTPHHLLETPLTGEIELAGYDLAIVPGPGSVLATLVLHWQVQANVTGDYLVAVQLVDSAGQALVTHTAVPVHQTRPTSTWLEGEWILDEHLIDVPALPPGEYQLSLSLVNEQTGEAVENSQGSPDLILENLKIP